MSDQEAIDVLEKMRRRCTNSSSDSEILKTSKENQAIDHAIDLIKKEMIKNGI